ncbi:FMN-binding protein MioC [Thalassomonas sp. M1454]|uniref:FMN-binding protein MioC n=1 Tax=Thalassomonas sp. M1454 TaxID=2594477 RepID=UPI00117EA70D|nr:FMN-binding protein MioC [Thalassomonas sp. M1454]TRX58131.1 FMN-binding protein MioC [Thalassomonas sp. M1454]
MSSFQIIVGSMLGGTEYVAEAVEEVLKEQNHSTKIHFQPNFFEIEQKDQTWVLCTSTHGAGDFPENIENFIHDLKSTDQDLSDLKFLVIAVGDSSYDTFCYAGKSLENTMLSKSANKLIDIFMIDMVADDDPEESAKIWITKNLDQL